MRKESLLHDPDQPASSCSLMRVLVACSIYQTTRIRSQPKSDCFDVQTNLGPVVQN